MKRTLLIVLDSGSVIVAVAVLVLPALQFNPHHRPGATCNGSEISSECPRAGWHVCLFVSHHQTQQQTTIPWEGLTIKWNDSKQGEAFVVGRWFA
jgi:hypothetical protein